MRESSHLSRSNEMSNSRRCLVSAILLLMGALYSVFADEPDKMEYFNYQECCKYHQKGPILTAEESNKQREEEHKQNEECDKAVKEIMEKRTDHTDPFEFLKCMMNCGYSKIKVMNPDGTLNEMETKSTFFRMVEVFEEDFARLVTEKCWGTFLVNVNQEIGKDVCNPAVLDFTKCVNNVRMAYCPTDHQNKEQRCTDHIKKLREGFEKS